MKNKTNKIIGYSVILVAMFSTIVYSTYAYNWQTIGGGKFVSGTNSNDAVYTTGNVGIGTTAPVAKLHIRNTTGAETGLYLDGGTEDIAIPDGEILQVGHLNATNGTFTNRLNILGNGNVGIGTTAPTQKLDINGGTRFRVGEGLEIVGDNNYFGTNADARVLRMTDVNGSTIDGGLAIEGFGADGTRTHIASFRGNGNVGIGVVNPAQKLHVVGNTRISGHIQDGGGQTLRDAGGGWVRTYGDTGWYNGTYGGGWYMADTTWLRAYNNRNIYTPNEMRAGSFVYSSDERLKQNITLLNDVDNILNISPKKFDWIDTDTKRNQKNDIGVIAQDVERYFPQFVYTDPETDYKTVDYPKLVVPLIGVVQNQQTEIELLKEEIKNIKALIQ